MIIRDVTHVNELKTGDLVYAQDFPTRLILAARNYYNEFYVTQIFLDDFRIIEVRLRSKDTFLNPVVVIRKDK
jgi:hypothetical protein